jgi:hypothetical protein
MLSPIHTRTTQLDRWPFQSTAEVDEFVMQVVAIVSDAMGAEPEVSISITYPDKAFPRLSHAGFREAQTELPFDQITTLETLVHDKEDPNFSVSLLLTAKRHSGRLSVRGMSVTRVDGVDIQVKKELDRGFARIQLLQDEEARHRREKQANYVEKVVPAAPFGLPVGAVIGEMIRAVKRARPAPNLATGTAAPSKPGRLRRFVNHPWTINVVGGLVVAIGGGAALALILS